MEVIGKVKAGQVQLAEPLAVPDGTTVRVQVADTTESPTKPNPYGDFWENASIDELARRQGVEPITSIEQLQASEPFDDEESPGEFERWLREIRR